MVVEPLGSAGDIREENEDIAGLFPGFSQSISVRFSFFRRSLSNLSALGSLDNSDFLGYVILKRDCLPDETEKIRVYESVIQASRHPNNCIRGMPDWHCCIAGEEYTIKGYVYAQQNGWTNCCSHVAITTVLSAQQKEQMSYRRMNSIVEPGRRERGITDRPGDGLYFPEIVQILESAGLKCYPVDYSKPSDMALRLPYQRLIYGSVESGYPAIIVLKMPDSAICHAIPVFGHTFNEDTWVPSAECSYFSIGRQAYIPSESWVSMYIVHDDNWGSNLCIPRHYLKSRAYDGNDHSQPHPLELNLVDSVIGTLPSGVKLNSIQAEGLAVDCLRQLLPSLVELFEGGSPNYWIRQFLLYAIDNRLILRAVLLKREEYVAHLMTMSDWARDRLGGGTLGEIVEGFKSVEDELFWLVEISIPELFQTNRRKLGEVVIRSQKEFDANSILTSLLFVRLPENFIFGFYNSENEPVFRRVPSGLRSHVALFGCRDEL